MSIVRNVLDVLSRTDMQLETYDRSGKKVNGLTGRELIDCARAHRDSFGGWDDDGRKVVALLFRSEETIEFLVATFAALSQGYTVVPLYPNWSEESQLEYLQAYRLHALAVGEGFRSRADSWMGTALKRVIPISTRLRISEQEGGPFDLHLSKDHACAWIFTSGTSGALAKLTEITLENLDAAVENIQELDFLYPGMTIHSPLSTSHIFAFVAIMGFLSVRPKRVLFSDVQFLARLSEERTGKVDGMILVPIVIHRLRAGFYEKLTAPLDPRTAPADLKKLARIPLSARRLLKRAVLRAEQAVIKLETQGRVGPAGWAAVQLSRKLFGRLFARKLGSASFVVVGGAKPNLEAMAFLEVMGIRCLQGWGMTETTGPLAVCRLGDRYQGAFGTCGTVFRETRVTIEEGELIVEGPQIARGYHQPDGSFVPFNGKKRTGDHGELDSAGRLKVLGKASDRITTDNGLNYDPIPMEEALHARDLLERQCFEEVVVIGDGQPRLGAVFFLREGVENGPVARAYVESILRGINSERAVDECINCSVISEQPFKEAGIIGPSGKLIRPRVEENYSYIFRRRVELAR